MTLYCPREPKCLNTVGQCIERPPKDGRQVFFSSALISRQKNLIKRPTFCRNRLLFGAGQTTGTQTVGKSSRGRQKKSVRRRNFFFSATRIKVVSLIRRAGICTDCGGRSTSDTLNFSGTFSDTRQGAWLSLIAFNHFRRIDVKFFFCDDSTCIVRDARIPPQITWRAGMRLQ